MKIATIILNNKEVASILTEFGFLPIQNINQRFSKNWPIDLFRILNEDKLEEIIKWYNHYNNTHYAEMKELIIDNKSIQFGPLYRHPRKIWGIGLNYKNHAKDLSEKTPTSEPASFMKPDTTVIGYDDLIKLPKQSKKTTGEAELGLIFGKECKDVNREDWQSVIAGYTSIIDMTAEDILRRNPRNLTQSKSFDTFFSFGPVFYTIDEVEDVFNLTVCTKLNGKICAENIVDNMTFPLDFLVSYHSQIMTMLPGDIISTGTPGATPLKNGDFVECQISGFHPLKNYITDLKIK